MKKEEFITADFDVFAPRLCNSGEAPGCFPEGPGVLLRMPAQMEAQELNRRIRVAKSNLEVLVRRAEIEARARAYARAFEQFRAGFAPQLEALRVRPQEVTPEAVSSLAWRVTRQEEKRLRDCDAGYRKALEEIKANNSGLREAQVQAHLARCEAEYHEARDESLDVISRALEYITGDFDGILRLSHAMVAEGKLDAMQAHIDDLVADYGSIENAETALQQAVLKGVCLYVNEIASSIRGAVMPSSSRREDGGCAA